MAVRDQRAKRLSLVLAVALVSNFRQCSITRTRTRTIDRRNLGAGPEVSPSFPIQFSKNKPSADLAKTPQPCQSTAHALA